MSMPKSPYGGGPGAGLTFPDYFKPTPSVRSRNNYFPNSEKLGPDEMRISFMGSTPFPPRTKLPEDLAYTKEDLEGIISARPDSE